jgi:hypothetical protein
MKRYRVLTIDFDARPNVLAVEVKDEWEPKIKALWLHNQETIRAEFEGSFGTAGRLDNYLAIGASPLSVIAFHNHFLREVRHAFLIESYYPALTGICALGERVLNHLVLKLRDEFTESPEYKKVYRRESFDDWNLAISTLSAWHVLLPAAAQQFRRLLSIRNEAVHFRPEIDHDARERALKAITLFQEIVTTQFGAFGTQPWYIPNDIGISFVRKRSERLPFVRRVVLPSCKLVGPQHELKSRPTGGFDVVDETDYPADDLSDDDFIKAFVAARAKR